MSAPLMMLGFFAFMPQTRAFEAMKRSRKFDWQSQPRLMRRPALQFTGLGDETIQIKGSWYKELTPNNEKIGDYLAMQGKLRIPLPVLFVKPSSAKFMGLWAITDIKEDHEYLDFKHEWQKIGYSLTLKQFGLDFAGWL